VKIDKINFMSSDIKLQPLPGSSFIDDIFKQKVSEIESRVPGRSLEKTAEPETSFFSELMSVMRLVREADKEAKEKSIKMVLGETEDIHDVMIAREKAETLFRLFLEIRNRAVQAFENIMRMQF
jgi:flagellar hook-basal body complex protein FliE